jgi:hypothetical protein
MTYTSTLTLTRPSDTVKFGSSNASLESMQKLVQKERKTATGFVGESRQTVGNVLTIIRTWATKANAEAFNAAHSDMLHQIYTLRDQYYHSVGITSQVTMSGT